MDIHHQLKDKLLFLKNIFLTFNTPKTRSSNITNDANIYIIALRQHLIHFSGQWIKFNKNRMVEKKFSKILNINDGNFGEKIEGAS